MTAAKLPASDASIRCGGSCTENYTPDPAPYAFYEGRKTGLEI